MSSPKTSRRKSHSSKEEKEDTPKLKSSRDTPKLKSSRKFLSDKDNFDASSIECKYEGEMTSNGVTFRYVKLKFNRESEEGRTVKEPFTFRLTDIAGQIKVITDKKGNPKVDKNNDVSYSLGIKIGSSAMAQRALLEKVLEDVRGAMVSKDTEGVKYNYPYYPHPDKLYDRKMILPDEDVTVFAEFKYDCLKVPVFEKKEGVCSLIRKKDKFGRMVPLREDYPNSKAIGKTVRGDAIIGLQMYAPKKGDYSYKFQLVSMFVKEMSNSPTADLQEEAIDEEYADNDEEVKKLEQMICSSDFAPIAKTEEEDVDVKVTSSKKKKSAKKEDDEEKPKKKKSTKKEDSDVESEEESSEEETKPKKKKEKPEKKSAKETKPKKKKSVKEDSGSEEEEEEKPKKKPVKETKPKKKITEALSDEE